MGFLKNLFLGSNSNNSNNLKNKNSALKKGSGAYETTVALEPPVKGSYPVAGNGNVEETLQRARNRRDSRQSQSRASSFTGSFRPPTTPFERPRTAPHNGVSGVQYASMGTADRTGSGFSMRDPPNTLSSNRRHSLRSTSSPRPAISLPSLPNSQVRYIQTYQPRGSATSVSDTTSNLNSHAHPAAVGFTPPYVENHHHRNFSQASLGSHVDVLDAYSTMKPKEASKHRVKASGLRVYGEDVADRNIADFGERDLAKLDLDSPDFGYMKSVYGTKSKKRHGDRDVDVTQQAHSDDTHKTISLPTSRFSTSSPRQHHNHSGGPSPTKHANNDYDGLDPISSKPSQYVTVHGGTRSSGSGVMSTSIDRFPMEQSRRHDMNSAQKISQQGSYSSRHTTTPVDPSSASSSCSAQPRAFSAVTSNTQPASTPSPLRISSTPDTHRATSSNNRSPNQHGRSVSRSSYSAFPPVSPRESSLGPTTASNSSRTMATSQRKLNYVIEGAREAPSLEGVIKLGNSEQTHVTTTTLPAVTHEFVRPTLHEIRTEKVTREIHNYEIFHRIQPIIETVILPTKHYIHSPDGKSLIEIPESQIPGRTGAGAANRNWKIVPTSLGEGSYAPPSQQDRGSRNSYIPPRTIASQPDEYEQAANSPLVHHGGQSASNYDDPILASKKDSISSEGIPRTEYLWRHKPQFENVKRPRDGPQHVGASNVSSLAESASRTNGRQSDTSDSSRERDYVLNDKSNGNMKEGDATMFRDSGYGSGGGLPNINAGGDLSRAFDNMDINKATNEKSSDPRTVIASGSPRGVRAKKSSVDLRRVAGQQEGISH